MRLLLGASLLLFACVQAASAETSCSSKIGSCEYYRCREELKSCGEDGYFLRFGYHYCTEFHQELRPEVSKPEARWLDNVAACLQSTLDQVPEATSCADTENAAISSHEYCYISTGFCWLPLPTKLRVLDVVYHELKDPRMLEVMGRISNDCGMLLGF